MIFHICRTEDTRQSSEKDPKLTLLRTIAHNWFVGRKVGKEGLLGEGYKFWNYVHEKALITVI